LTPPPPTPRNGREAGGAGFRTGCSHRNGDSTAPFAPESQFFLDHIVAGRAKAHSWIDDLTSGRVRTFAEIAEREGKVERDVRLLIPPPYRVESE
jgi:hypothetical protein